LALQDVKVAFQTRTASAWGTNFLHHLNAELQQALRTDHQQLTDQICSLAQALFDARRRSLSGQSSLTALGMCVLILNAYRVLVVQLGSSEQAFEVVERSFDQTYQAFIDNVCKPLYLDAKRSPQNLAKMNFSDWSKCMYQTAGVQSSSAHEAILERDASDYHSFFQEHHEPGLSRIIDAADLAWAQAIAAFNRPVDAESRRTRVSDAGFCPFRFAPKTVKRQPARPDLVFELLSDPPSATETRRGET